MGNQTRTSRVLPRTASLRAALTLISAALCFSSNPATACSLALQVSAKMSPNSSELTNADRLRLVNLVINVRHLPLRSEAIVYGYALPEERDAAALARRRTDSVVNFLTQMGVLDTDLVHVESGVVSPSSKHDRTELVDVQFSPICPTGGCGFLCNMPIQK